MRETAKAFLVRRRRERIERGMRPIPFITVAEFGLRFDETPPVLFVRGTGLPPSHDPAPPCPNTHGGADTENPAGGQAGGA